MLSVAPLTGIIEKLMAKNKRTNKFFVIFIAIVTAVSLAGLTGVFSGAPAPKPNSTSQETADTNNQISIPCLTGKEFQLRSRLIILLDGKEISLPADIGVEPDCTRELHTQDADGFIYVESDTDKGYTFADFLGMLGLGLQQAGYITKLTVDGEFDDNNPNFKLEDGQEIVLEYIKIPSDLGAVKSGSQETVPESQ